MEQQLVRLLTDTQSGHEAPRKNAEWQLKQQYSDPDFPIGLLSIAAHHDLPINTRQSALLVLKMFVQACWSPQLDDFNGQPYTDEAKKAQIRQYVLDLALSGREERKVQRAACLVVSKIATADFPDDWPVLLPTVLNVVATGIDAQLHSALTVLAELVDDCFNEEQFFKVARDLVKVVYDVAVNDRQKSVLRALAVSVFRSCFDILEMVMEDHKAAVKQFAEETLSGWLPFFIDILKSPLPIAPTDDDEDAETGAPEVYRGLVALKLQVVKVLMRIRSVFPSTLSPHSPALFMATWQELTTLQSQYLDMYIKDDRQGRLEDADGLPYTLDFLVLEELDFMQACLRAPPVRKELESQLSSTSTSWMTDVLKIAVAYAQITTEEEGLWDIDVNVFLSEEANVTANYTPRTACGDLVIKLGEWLNAATVDGLLAFTRTLYAENAHWKAKEAALYLLNQLLGDFQDVEKKIGPDAANGYVDFIRHAMQEEAVFLRARGYLVAGSLTRTSGDALQPVAATFMEASVHAIASDSSDIVKVSCIRALQYYLAALPPAMTLSKQSAIINALSNYLNNQDLSDLADHDDLLIAVIETLRDAILLDTSTCLTGGGVDLLFTVASRGANNFQIALFVIETFEEIASTVSATGSDQYAQLTRKVLPSLTGAFDVATLTEENALANLAAELLSVLAEHGSTPMPRGFVAAVMPRLNRLLLESQDEELLKSSTSAVKHMLRHDPEQVFSFEAEAGKSGLEIVLIIIDRLLKPEVDDNGAAEVGGLAAELVEKAGSARLGPYLMQLLRAVAARLATAEQAAFIQSLILVFARLSLTSAQDVVSFLADVDIEGESGLRMVMAKWLENSVHFAGYENIRTNVTALTKIYELNDPRLTSIQVKGDLIVPKSDRIMTRSRARETPDHFTIIPAQLKIIKVLIEELLSASGNRAIDAAAAAELEDDDEDNDGDWEDDANDFLDLGAGMTKSQLMSLGADEGYHSVRGRDDETQAFLLAFFREAAQKPGFGDVFNSLTSDEQEKLRRMGEVLPLANSAGGHRLGVNGLAVDSEHSILYSGGRDGVICAWDLHLDLRNPSIPEYDEKLSRPPPTTFRAQVQAHTHWINDIALAHSNQALLSASSDVTVKCWRPAATDGLPPQTIGLHSDYVKTLAVPSPSSDWAASGGLDRKIFLWDINGGGQRLCIDVGEDEAGSLSSKEKGSVYALAATNNVIASGGPESTVRVWDARTGKRITKLVGHTDNIRDVLVSRDGSTIMTASSDRTVKVWSTVAGRCMYTLTMHDMSVWSLFSADPDLSVFYSSDKSGLVAKTDTRDVVELDEGITVAVAQEHEGVHKVVAAGDCIWTATSRPSINRWRDVNTEHAEIDVPESYNANRSSIASTTRLRYPSPPNPKTPHSAPQVNGVGKRKLPLKHMLRLSNAAYWPAPVVNDAERRSSVIESKRELPADLIPGQPLRSQPDHSIEGQNGLIKHVMLNDRKRVLTMDTAGEVVMWDLLKCVPIRSYGKRHLEDVKDEVATTATVANWCTVDTRTGSVAVTLEEKTCFDAEMYADELDLDEGIDFREDQRINLGKWVLRYLFSNLITEEIKRDDVFRKQLLSAKEQQRLQRENAPSSIQLPQNNMNGWHQDEGVSGGDTTPRPTNGLAMPQTPGLAIGIATPGVFNSPGRSVPAPTPLSPTTEEGALSENRMSQSSQGRQSTDRSSDYFSSPKLPSSELTSISAAGKPPVTPGEGAADNTTPPAGDGTSKDTPSKEGLFGKKFRMGMSFSGMKKIGRTQTSDKDKAAVVEEKDEAESDSRSSKTSNSRIVDDNFLGTIQKIRFGYEDSLQQQLQTQQAHENGLPIAAPGEVDISSAITPSLPAETPVLKPPLNTTILIQEDRPEAGGVADLFEGKVGQLGELADLVEKAAPAWLGEMLLKNQIPTKDVVKISFVLEPYNGSEPAGGLPSIETDGNNRLNANRMLRAKKILAYVAERIEPGPSEAELAKRAATGAAELKPEEYLELWCHDQVVPPSMTLATIRSHLWRGGGDIVLYYRANGRKQILHAPPVQAPGIVPPKTATDSAGNAAAGGAGQEAGAP